MRTNRSLIIITAPLALSVGLVFGALTFTYNNWVDGLLVDNDFDGYTERDGDCNDLDSLVHPDASNHDANNDDIPDELQTLMISDPHVITFEADNLPLLIPPATLELRGYGDGSYEKSSPRFQHVLLVGPGRFHDDHKNK